MQVILLQGVPGSGKSTYGRRLVEETKLSGKSVEVVSADFFFEKDGEYRFDPTKLEQAHASCFMAFLRALEKGTDLVIVDNTNTKIEFMTPYVLAMSAANLARPENPYTCKVVQVPCDPKVAARRNTHGVPEETCCRMAREIERCQFPPRWTVERVTA